MTLAIQGLETGDPGTQLLIKPPPALAPKGGSQETPSHGRLSLAWPDAKWAPLIVVITKLKPQDISSLDTVIFFSQPRDMVKVRLQGKQPIC